VIAFDTNLLVYAHRADSPFHDRASLLLTQALNGKARWAIPWPCVHEFISVVTHARIFKQPTPLALALDVISGIAKLANVQLLAEDDGYWQQLIAAATPARVQGPMIHDARIAALCLHHGIAELWSADRDFSRFPGLKVINPLLG